MDKPSINITFDFRGFEIKAFIDDEEYSSNTVLSEFGSSTFNDNLDEIEAIDEDIHEAVMDIQRGAENLLFALQARGDYD